MPLAKLKHAVCNKSSVLRRWLWTNWCVEPLLLRLWPLQWYGEAAELDNSFLTSYGLAWSTTSERVSAPIDSEACFILNKDYVTSPHSWREPAMTSIRTQIFTSHVWQSRRVRYLFFDQLWLSMEQVSIIATGWGSVNLSMFTYHPLKFGYSSRRERWIFNNRGVILTLIHWLGPPFF